MILRTIDSVVQDYASLRTALLARSLRDEHDVALTGHGAANNVSLVAASTARSPASSAIVPARRVTRLPSAGLHALYLNPRTIGRGGQQQKQAQNSDKLTLVSALASPEVLHGSLPLWIVDSGAATHITCSRTSQTAVTQCTQRQEQVSLLLDVDAFP
jgi:hypothetical protein